MKTNIGGLNEIFISKVNEFIENEFISELYENYDNFYNNLFRDIQNYNIRILILYELEQHKYNTIEYCCEMIKTINSIFGTIKYDDFNQSYIIDSYSCFIVGENGQEFYEYYKTLINKKKVITTNDVVLDECTICYDKKQLLTTICNHNFCNDCLFKINHCAMCRTLLSNSDSDSSNE